MSKSVSKKLFSVLCMVGLLAGGCNAVRPIGGVSGQCLVGCESSVSDRLVFNRAKFNDESLNKALKDQLVKFKGKVEGNQEIIEAVKKDPIKMAEINAYFRDHKIYVVDFAEGNALLNNDGKPMTAGQTVRRTAMFIFFKGLGVITPTFGALKALMENQGWSAADMEKAMQEATAGTNYRIPVELDEDTKIYAYVKSNAKVSGDHLEVEFQALCPKKDGATA